MPAQKTPENGVLFRAFDAEEWGGVQSVRRSPAQPGDAEVGPDEGVEALNFEVAAEVGKRLTPLLWSSTVADETELRTASDGLPARVVKAHTLEKFDRHGKYCATFNNAMRYFWKENRGYLELFAGPGSRSGGWMFISALSLPQYASHSPMRRRRRRRTLLLPVVLLALCLAAVASSSAAASTAQATSSISSPKAQALGLRATMKTTAVRFAVVSQKLNQMQKQANDPNACGGALKAMPKDKQKNALGFNLSYWLVAKSRPMAQVFVAADRDVAALHLTDPAFKSYAAALHRFAVMAGPLAALKPIDFCTAIDRWKRAGYAVGTPPGYSALWAMFGVTEAQASIFLTGTRALTRAGNIATKRAHALGVTLGLVSVK